MTDISTKPIGSMLMTESLGKKEITCEKHGLYVSTGMRITIGQRREIWTQCPGCSADAREREQQAAAAEKAEAAKRRLEAMLQQTSIPHRFIGRSFDNFQVHNDGQGRALAVCRDYAANFERCLAKGSSLVLSGAAGAGKSHLASAILQAILPNHVGAYMTFMGMIRLIRETWRPESEKSESQVIGELGSIPLLVIDEIGVQYGTEAEHTLLFEVMDRRYRDQMPSILMTNQDKDGFKRFVGDRVYDRMTEVARWVSFDWASFRTQARKEFD